MKKRDLETAKHLLKKTHMEMTDAIRLVIEMLEESDATHIEGRDEAIKHCRQIIQMGSHAQKMASQSVTFQEALETLIEKKVWKRERTKTELHQIRSRLLSSMPEIGGEKVRMIDTDKCRELIEKSYSTVPTRKKAKRVLSALFRFCIANGWCDKNPTAGILLPPHKEKPIKALQIHEVLRLLKTAEQPEHRVCAPALGIMLWAGIRPHEIERLTVNSIDYEDRVITIPAKHAKTGGARQVTMHPVLIHWLRSTLTHKEPEAPLTPPSWSMRWAQLRKAAGFKKWPPDVLRHTFASYHLKYFKSLHALQLEMGHADLELLRTRYLSMDKVTVKAAKIFWNYALPSNTKHH